MLNAFPSPESGKTSSVPQICPKSETKKIAGKKSDPNIAVGQSEAGITLAHLEVLQSNWNLEFKREYFQHPRFIFVFLIKRED